jgi:hypothetical protein
LNANKETKKLVTKGNMDSLQKKLNKKGLNSGDTLVEIRKLWSAIDQGMHFLSLSLFCFFFSSWSNA